MLLANPACIARFAGLLPLKIARCLSSFVFLIPSARTKLASARKLRVSLVEVTSAPAGASGAFCFASALAKLLYVVLLSRHVLLCFF